MLVFSLRMKDSFSRRDLEEYITLEVDLEDLRSLKKIIKDFLEARKYL